MKKWVEMFAHLNIYLKDKNLSESSRKRDYAATVNITEI